MKKLLLFLLLLLVPGNVLAYSARNMIAMDMDTKRVLYESNVNDPHLIASITKIMTAVVALELADIESEVTITDVVLKSFGSGIYVEIGEKIKLKDLLYGLMLRSGNDAALAIAEYVGRDVDTFVEYMNTKAKEIGMKNTKFINPHGLENNKGEGNISTAYDMALLSSYAMQNEQYREIVGTKHYVAKSDKKTYSWTNKNKLLTSYEYTTGGKTGFTEKARRTLVSNASRDGANITIVTLNDPNDWEDHKDLYNDLFHEYKSEKIIDKNHFRIDGESYYKNENLFLKEDVSILLKNDEKNDISLDIQLQKKEEYEDGDVVGKVQIKLKENVLKEVPVYVSLKNSSEKKQNLFQKILGWFRHD